jgi:hypothetical protein
MTRRLLALVVGICALSSAPASATPLREFATAEVRLDRDVDVFVTSDTRRWYAYQRRRGSVIAVDSRTGRRRPVAAPEACELRDVRLASLLLDCMGDPVARLVRLPSRRPTDFAQPFEDRFVAIGRYWLGGFSCSENLHCGQVYLNRRTLERRTVDSSAEEDPNVLLRDVDTRGLDEKEPDLRVDMRAGSYRLTAGTEPDAPLVLRHRGRRRTLSKCARLCMFPTLGGSLVTWAEGRIVRAFSLTSGRTTRWRVPFRTETSGYVTALAHTRRLVLVRTTEPGTSPLTSHQTLLRASVPKQR